MHVYRGKREGSGYRIFIMQSLALATDNMSILTRFHCLTVDYCIMSGSNSKMLTRFIFFVGDQQIAKVADELLETQGMLLPSS